MLFFLACTVAFHIVGIFKSYFLNGLRRFLYSWFSHFSLKFVKCKRIHKNDTWHLANTQTTIRPDSRATIASNQFKFLCKICHHRAHEKRNNHSELSKHVLNFYETAKHIANAMRLFQFNGMLAITTICFFLFAFMLTAIDHRLVVHILWLVLHLLYNEILIAMAVVSGSCNVTDLLEFPCKVDFD